MSACHGSWDASRDASCRQPRRCPTAQCAKAFSTVHTGPDGGIVTPICTPGRWSHVLLRADTEHSSSSCQSLVGVDIDIRSDARPFKLHCQGVGVTLNRVPTRFAMAYVYATVAGGCQGCPCPCSGTLASPLDQDLEDTIHRRTCLPTATALACAPLGPRCPYSSAEVAGPWERARRLWLAATETWPAGDDGTRLWARGRDPVNASECVCCAQRAGREARSTCALSM
ncbi:hypothetical protein C8Q80DRAFT_492747 [Daedaleopsis nitida]|nr:hypothetical protein C8Q80DRAFT_492747 [Daedaleopsis nitida]